MNNPEKAIKTKFMSLRLPEDIHAQVMKAAQENTRTLAAQVLHFIKAGIEGKKK